MAFCIPKFAVDTFISKLKDGTIDPEKLSNMTSEQRRAFFSEIVGDANAKQVNALFESKLILKNQELGMINWAKKIANLSPEVRRDMISKIEKLGKVLTPEERTKFLEDFIEKRLGVAVTVEEAGKLVDASRKVQEYKSLIKENTPDGSTERVNYGASLVAFEKYVSDLKTKTISDSKFSAKETIFKIGDAAKEIQTNPDISFFGRQGWKVLTNAPLIWLKSFGKVWGDIGRQLTGTKGFDAGDAIRADIYSRKNALNGNYKRTDAAIGLRSGEEAMPTNFLNKIPGIGRVVKAAEVAYNGSALRIRADLLDWYIDNMTKAGLDITDRVQAESIGRLVNQMTGRGDIGKLATFGRELNFAVYSTRFLKSQIEFLTDPLRLPTDKITGYTRKQASYNLLRTAAVSAGLMAIAQAMNPDDNKDIFNTNSSRFGKIKTGASTADVTGGLGSLIVLASRLVSGVSTSVSGNKTELNSGKFGGKTKFDVVIDFLDGKAAPGLNTIITWLKGKDFNGDKATVGNLLKNLVTPMPVGNIMDTLNNPKSAPLLLNIILDGIGISVNTSAPKK